MTSTADDNKYRNWVFTYFLDDLATDQQKYEEGFLYSVLKQIASSFVFQLEKGETTSKLHFQGCFQVPYRIRHKTLLNKFRKAFETYQPELGYYDFNVSDKIEGAMERLTIDRMQGTWEESQAYCTKKETSVNPPIYSPDLEVYNGEDITFLESENSRYSWQDDLFKEFFDQDETFIKAADSRTIFWITDEQGCTGKSKFVKYCCFSNPNCAKVSFGSSTQLRSSLIALGRKKLYFIDIPRTLGKEDHLEDLITVLEDLKNGFLVSCMYGKYQSLMMDPPHVVVFSNQYAPFNHMSSDRWKAYKIDNSTKKLIQEPYGRIHH